MFDKELIEPVENIEEILTLLLLYKVHKFCIIRKVVSQFYTSVTFVRCSFTIQSTNNYCEIIEWLHHTYIWFCVGYIETHLHSTLSGIAQLSKYPGNNSYMIDIYWTVIVSYKQSSLFHRIRKHPPTTENCHQNFLCVEIFRTSA